MQWDWLDKCRGRWVFCVDCDEAASPELVESVRRVLEADAAGTLRNAFGVDRLDWPGSAEAALTRLAPGHAFTVPDVLFAKISDEDRADWQTRFAGRR